VPQNMSQWRSREQNTVAQFKDKNLSRWRLPITVHRGSIHVQKILIRRYNARSFIFCYPSRLDNSKFLCEFVNGVSATILLDMMPSVFIFLCFAGRAS